MAKKKQRIVFDFDEHRTKIRYKRAYLTVEQIVAVNFTPVEDALAGHRSGKVSGEEVAEAFLREQVVAHTPSFDWEETELGVLLERVTAVMNGPKLKARTPSELVPELEAVEVEERKRWKEMGERTQRYIAPLSKELQEKMQQAYKPVFTEQMQKMMRKHTQTIFGSLADNPALSKAMEPSLIKIHGDLGEIARSLLPEVRLIDFGVDQDFFEELRQSVLGDRPLMITTNWDQWIEQAVSRAQEVEVRETTDGAGERGERPDNHLSELDIKELIDGLSEIAKALQKQAGGHPVAMTIVTAVISGLILYAIQYVLAVKYGITPTPPEQSSP